MSELQERVDRYLRVFRKEFVTKDSPQIIISDLNNALKEAIAKSEWISVKDNLPYSQSLDDEGNDTYLIYTSEFGRSKAMFCNSEWYLNYTAKIIVPVTHWQPLPEPPKDS